MPYLPRINLQGDELEMYYRVHQALAEKILTPDLVVYLRADTEILMQRIASRDRPYERQMEKDYIHKLNQAYETFFADSPSNMKVLTIDTNTLNFVSRSEDLKWVEDRIRQVLHLPPFQESFPL